MRRVLYALGLLGIVLGAGFFFVERSASTETPPEPAPPATDPVVAEPARPQPPPQRGAAIAGHVELPDGKAAVGAHVAVAGSTPREVTCDPSGNFRIADLGPGEYTVSAQFETLAAEPLGPIPLAAGEEVRDLILRMFVSATLSGRVLDSMTGAPIPKAVVTAGASRAVSDVSGAFRLLGLPGGSMPVHASAAGHMPRTAEVPVPRGKERSGLDIHLDPSGRIEGTVSGPSGEPVADAAISSFKYSVERVREAPVLGGRSDGSGAFGVDVAPGDVSLFVVARSFSPELTKPFSVQPGKIVHTMIQLSVGGRIVGVIRTKSGAENAPSMPCTITVNEPDTGQPLGSVASDAQNHYEVGPLPPDRALTVIAACGARGAAVRGGVHVPDGDTTQVDLEVGGGVISGRVVDAFERPVSGAFVTVAPDAEGAPPTANTTSIADGSFQLADVPAGRLRVSAQSDYGIGQVRGVEAGATKILLRVSSAALIGYVSVSGGESLADFSVVALPVDANSGQTRTQRFLDPTGDFHMPVAPGRYQVRVRAPGFPAATQGPVTVEAGQQSPTLRFALARPGTITGRVVSSAGGAAISGARVATGTSALWAFGRTKPVPAESSTVTDSQGHFQLDDVPAGTSVQLFAYQPGFNWGWPPTTAEVPADGSAADVTIQLTPSSNPDDRQDFGGIGMVVGTRGNQFFAGDAVEGGPAWEAGIRSGDGIESVDGTPAAGMRVDELVNRIRGEAGTQVTLGMSRSGQAYTAVATRSTIRF
jgi:hypothetical protein